MAVTVVEDGGDRSFWSFSYERDLKDRWSGRNLRVFSWWFFWCEFEIEGEKERRSS